MVSTFTWQMHHNRLKWALVCVGYGETMRVIIPKQVVKKGKRCRVSKRQTTP
jgi:hypothetical protein